MEKSVDPGLSSGAIESMEIRLGVPLPIDFRLLLGLCSGYRMRALGPVDFTGNQYEFEFELLPVCLPLLDDGCGNFWALDLSRDSGALASVFYSAHDPPVFIRQFAALNEFIQATLDPCHDILKTTKALTRQVDDLDEKGLTVAECVRSTDSDLQTFALGLPGNSRIFDLRERASPSGFVWAPASSNPVLARYGSQLLFAVSEIDDNTEGSTSWRRELIQRISERLSRWRVTS